MVAYHDEEWGRPVTDDRRLFEILCLEGFQAGLAWQTILRKRDGFRRAFAYWHIRAVARFDEADRARLLADPGIVRHRGKIDAAIGNAQALLRLIEAEGSFLAYLGRRVAQPPRRQPPTARPEDLPARTPESEALSRDLRSRGFRFVGPTVVYAFMQATGLVDDHLPGCFRYAAA